MELRPSRLLDAESDIIYFQFGTSQFDNSIGYKHFFETSTKTIIFSIIVEPKSHSVLKFPLAISNCKILCSLLTRTISLGVSGATWLREKMLVSRPIPRDGEVGGVWPAGVQAQARRGCPDPGLGGVCVSQHARSQTPLPPADGYCSGRYASYWNAFLFTNVLN